jgi:hypothetical protein
MKLEAQRVAIAEACGFERKIMRSFRETPGWYAETPSGTAFFENIPDYLNDLNAISAAIKLQNWSAEQQHQFFQIYLFNIFARREGFRDSCQVACNPNASDWCEAFLKTIGKWEP